MSFAITPDKFKSFWQYKYVFFSDNKVLFCDAGNRNVNHGNLRDEHPEARPVSAGQIKIKKNGWIITEGGSTTLKIPRMPSDEKHIGIELGKFGLVYDEAISF